MFKRISLYPPLAFARVGSSSKPCDNFYWGPDDLTPQGTARTRIVPSETLKVGKDGVVTLAPKSDTVVFKDDEGLRPVCPFFEVHVEWDDGRGNKGRGPLTPELLKLANMDAKALNWTVEIANRKAAHITGSDDDAFGAVLNFTGEVTTPQFLEGRSSGIKPLVPKDRLIPLGFVQATQPAGDFPEFRLRFTPPSGKVYAPTDFAVRVGKLRQTDKPIRSAKEALVRLAAGEDPKQVREDYALTLNRLWAQFQLPKEQCLLNADAEWPHYSLLDYENMLSHAKELLPRFNDLLALTGSGDRSELVRALRGPHENVGNLPPGLFAYAAEPPNVLASLGMVDDMGDGTISVRLGDLTATSRIVIAPPSFAPDRRLPVSLADGLVDRIDRDAVRNEGWVCQERDQDGADGQDEADKVYYSDLEVGDLLDRAYETAGLQNVDAVIDFFREENRSRALRRDNPLTPQQAADLLWDGSRLTSVHGLPLAAYALQRHRRNTSRLVFEIVAREARGWFRRWIRPPADPQKFYDRRMPGLMRGFDRHPLHLTRRQYEALKAWSKWKPKS
jgi:hypothetical protein